MDKEIEVFEEIVKLSSEIRESAKENYDPKKFKNYYEKCREFLLPFVENSNLAKALVNLAESEIEIINEELKK